MDAFSLESDFGSSRIEVFVFQFAHLASIHGVSPVATKFFDIEMVCATTNFFVWRKTNPDFSVLDFGIVDQEFHCTHDFGDSGFVVGAKKRGSVSRD